MSRDSNYTEKVNHEANHNDDLSTDFSEDDSCDHNLVTHNRQSVDTEVDTNNLNSYDEFQDLDYSTRHSENIRNQRSKSLHQIVVTLT